MLGFGNLHQYQVRAIRFALDHPSCALWLDMGLGKTTVVLHALQDLFDQLVIHGVLIVAPLRVCQTVWRQEARKWSYTRELTFSLIHGSPKQREKALRRPAQIYLINYEGLLWLETQINTYWLGRGLPLPFNAFVLDEITRAKSTRIIQGGKRGRMLLTLGKYCDIRIGLTGTPASNGYLDLFGQYLCLDSGARLGTSFEAYRREYFYQMDYNGRVFAPFVHSEQAIRDKIVDITVSMSNEEYLSLPPKIVNDIWVDLPAKVRQQYEDMEKQFFLELDSGESVDITSESALSNRCLQVSNGAVYLRPGEPEWREIHDTKLKALEEIIEEAAGKPVLIAYQFRHDAHRILEKYPRAKWINSSLSENEMLQIQHDWNEKKLPLLLGHPASIGHGLNLQLGSNIIVFFGLNWSNDLYSQAIARLRRQGQSQPVYVHRIMTRDTLDEAQRLSLLEKQTTEAGLRAAIEQYRSRKK